MSKSKSTAAVAAKPVGPVISVTTPCSTVFRGARAAWYAHLVAFNNATVAEFTEAAVQFPPSTPAKGKLAGQCEPPAGWLRWFVKHGYATLTTPQA